MHKADYIQLALKHAYSINFSLLRDFKEDYLLISFGNENDGKMQYKRGRISCFAQ